MPRLNIVAKAKRAQGNCETCREPINVGDAYCHWSAYRGRKHVYHATPACKPSPDRMETNEKRAAHVRASALIDQARDAETATDAAQYVNDAIAEVESINELLQESLDNWSGTNFEYGNMAQNFEATKDDLESWISDAEIWVSDFESIDDDILTGGPGVKPDPEDFEGGEDDADYQVELTDYEETDAKYLAEFEALADGQSAIEDVPDLSF